MPLTRRIVKGAPLTGAEHDGNLDFFVAGLTGKAEATDPRLTDARAPTAHNQAISTITGLQGALDGKATAGAVAALEAALDGKADDDDARLSNARAIANGGYGLFDVSGGTASLSSAAGLMLLASIRSVDAAEFRTFAGEIMRALATDAETPSQFYWTGDGDIGGEWRRSEDLDFATPAQIWARETGNRVVTVEAWRDANAPVPLSVSGAVALDLNTGINFDITVTGAMTFNLPTGIEATKEGVIRFFGTGAHAITLGSSSNLLNKSAITFQSGAGAETHVYYRCRGATQVELGMMWSKAA